MSYERERERERERESGKSAGVKLGVHVSFFHCKETPEAGTQTECLRAGVCGQECLGKTVVMVARLRALRRGGAVARDVDGEWTDRYTARYVRSSGCPGEAEACVVRAWRVREARDKGLRFVS